MAKRPVFISNVESEGYVEVKNIDFKWYPGFSIKQKQKSIQSLHNNALSEDSYLKILEVSSKSDEELGVSLSAFNLMIETKKGRKFSVETAFQGSKVFENGGPFTDLYQKTSREAKRDPRLRESGNLIGFKYFNKEFELEPKTFFYDWLYINTLYLNKSLSNQIINYDAFTDIEFNPQKSINCQARSVALYVSLYKLGLLNKALLSVEDYKKVIMGETSMKNLDEKVKREEKFKVEQLNIFDRRMEE